MTELCTTRRSCRLCNDYTLTKVFGLTPTPLANAFVTEEALGIEQPTFPLDIYFCENCAHVQLLDVVDPSVLFETYLYVSGTSPAFIAHFADYANSITKAFSLRKSGGLVVDIGSNDGTLLNEFKNLGHEVLGIDPARDIAAKATAGGIETLATFFSADLAQSIRDERGAARIITANNVFAHADDLKGIARGVRTLLAPDGVFVFEVSYLADVFKKTLFDTIYHEHLAYHSVKPLLKFFADNGMELFRTEQVDSHGGSLRGYAQHRGGPHKADGTVRKLIALESRLGLDKADTFFAYADHINALKAELCERLTDLKSQSKTIAGFGAPAKATTLMYHFGIGADLIDFIVDDSPIKQGLYSPGLHVPVVGPDALYERAPGAVIILAWNFAKPIMHAHAEYLDQGGQFIVPLPNVEVYEEATEL